MEKDTYVQICNVVLAISTKLFAILPHLQFRSTLKCHVSRIIKNVLFSNKLRVFLNFILVNILIFPMKYNMDNVFGRLMALPSYYRMHMNMQASGASRSVDSKGINTPTPRGFSLSIC